MPSIVLTKPTGISSGNFPGGVVSDIAVPYNMTTTIDQCDCTSAKWFYTIIDNTDNTSLTGEVSVHQIGGDVRWIWHSIVGDVETLKHTITAQYDGSSDTIDLQIFNNDTGGHDWVASLVRIETR